MKQKPFFKPILFDAWILTWRNKVWWLISLLTLVLTSYLSYQVISQGVTSLTSPDLWLSRWQSWTNFLHPVNFFQNQWQLLTSDPKGWFIMLLVWALILFTILIIFSISVAALTVLISGVKTRDNAGRFGLLLALRETIFHFKPVFWAVILSLVASNAVVVVLSLPMVWLGLGSSSVLNIFGLIVLFALFFIVSFIVAIVTIYAILYIILDDYSLSGAIIAAWDMLRRYWLVSLEMLVLQIGITLLLVFAVTLLISLLVVSVTIIGTGLIASQQYDIISFLPIVMIYLVAVLYIVLGSVYTMFQLVSWALLFRLIEKVNPSSRLTQFAEAKLAKS